MKKRYPKLKNEKELEALNVHDIKIYLYYLKLWTPQSEWSLYTYNRYIKHLNYCKNKIKEA